MDRTVVPFMRSICYPDPVDFVHPVEAVIPGVQGRVLAVLVKTTAELNLRTLARLAGVSVAQASRLGVVERHEVPPSSLFRLNRAHVAAQPIMALARSRDDVLRQLGVTAAQMRVQPESVIVFGSFARGEADAQSDIDAVVVRRDDVAEDDDEWTRAVESWRQGARAISGNRTEVIEVSSSEIARKLTSDAPLWRNVAQQGVVVHGWSLHQLGEVLHA